MEEKITFESYLRQFLTPIIQEIGEKAIARQSPAPAAPQTSFPEFMDLQMTAEFLHLAPSSIYGLVHKSLIPHYKRNKRLLFRKDELEKWLADSRRQTIEEIRADALNSLGRGRRR
jgi:hypothetical protein